MWVTLHCVLNCGLIDRQMERKRGAIADNPKDALRLYLEELETDYYPWYRRSSNRLKWAWGVGQSTALIAGVLASVLAAATPQAKLTQFGFVRIALIVLPIVGALASSLLAQTHAKDLLALREGGREKIQDIIARARAEYAAAGNDLTRLSSLHSLLIDKVGKLEREQASGFLSTAPGGRP
jgi:hypothetical protein